MKTLRHLVLIVSVLGFCGSVSADRRSHVWTYEYMTMPKGAKEIEYYYTAKIPRGQNAGINTMEHQLEFEYGITDHWDVALYQRLLQDNRSSENDTSYHGFKIRTRYRFGEKGQFLLDPLLYLEYHRSEEFSEPNEIETKVILAKDIGDVNISYNQILERDLESVGKTEHAYAFGVHYRLQPRFSFGVEAKGSYSGRKYYIGPTISFVFKRMWIACGVVRGLTNASDDIQSRIIAGIPF